MRTRLDPSRTLTAAAFVLALIVAPQAPCHAQPCPARWDPTPGVPGLSNIVYDALPLPSGDIIFAGSFTTAGNAPANRIARFRPSTGAWFTYGSGFPSGIVTSIVTTPNGDLFAGGVSTTGPTPGFLARWNAASSTWTTINAAIGAGVNALLTMPDGSILIASNATTPASPIAPLARFSPSTGDWSSWNFDFGNHVSSLILAPGGDVYAAGALVQRLDAATNTWSAIPAPTGPFHSLAILPSGDLITSVPSGTDHGIWRRDQSTGTWSQMGSLGSAYASAFPITPTGDLFAFGLFTISSTPSPILSTFIRWDSVAAQWSAVPGAPVNGQFPFTIEFDAPVLANGDLLLAGSFFTVDGRNARNLAIWTRRPSCPGDFNCSGSLNSQDIVDFLNAWFNDDPITDFDRAGGRHVSDIFAFLNAWFAGC